MKKFFRVLVIFLLTFSLLSTPALATTGVPSIITYQGNLTDSGGNTLGGAGTLYYFKFSFWDSPTVGQGNKLWPASSPTATSLTVKRGVFSVNIGDTASGYPDTLNYDFNTNNKTYLQVEISSDNVNFETLSPRSLITSTPFTQVADRVVGTNQSSFGTTTPITGSLISAITTGINQVAMTIRGIAGQVANLFNIQDSSGNSLFTVTSGGNVGVGTSTPFAKFSIQQSYGSSMPLFSIASTTSSSFATSSVFTVLANGNVGIGTTMPSSPLDIYGSATGAATIFNVTNSANNTTMGFFQGLAPNMPTGGEIAMTFGQSATARNRAYIGFDYLGSGSTSNRMAFGFHTAGELVSILASGNVGIGTVSPSQLLHIKGTAARMKIESTGGGDPVLEMAGTGYTNYFFTNQTDGGWYLRTDSNSRHVFLQSGHPGGAGNQGNVQIGYGSNSGNAGPIPTSQLTIRGNTNSSSFGLLDVQNYSGTSTLFVRSDGNVGVGTTTPSAKLQVTTSSTNTQLIRLSDFSIGSAEAGPYYSGFYQGSVNDVSFNLARSDASFALMGGGVNGDAYRRILIGADGTMTWGSGSGSADVSLQRSAAGIIRLTANDANTDKSVSLTTYTKKAGPTNSYYSINGGLNVNTNDLFTGARASTMNFATGVVGNTTGTSYDMSFWIGNTGGRSEALTIKNSGNVGIGTTTPSAQLHTTGTVRFGALTGAGANLIVDANGNVTVSSDERLKNIQNTFDRGLSDIEKINPIVFKWKPETGYDTSSTYTGFSAQNIQLAIPEAVATDSKGFLTLADRPILATVVNAVKELAQKIQTVLAWFGGDGSKFEVKGDVCVDSVCVTKDQFKTLLQNGGGTGSGGSSTVINIQTPTTPTSPDPVSTTTSSSTDTTPVPEVTPETPATPTPDTTQ